ncbi:beta-galactosidase [Spirochaeta dissipatitropha]
MYYGCDYNPEQWLHEPAALDRDITLMKKANINSATLGMFSWSSLEPEENQFRFDWLRSVIDRLYAAEIAVILGTPSGARPHWLAAKYPEVLRVNARREQQLFGDRHNHCYTSPAYRTRIGIINRRLAEEFAAHPAVELWHLSNEYGGECHCENCQKAFREYLENRYETLDALNYAWWNTFWSKNISSWDQIESPSPIGEGSVHGLNLDWRRFVTHQTKDFMLYERDCLKEVNPDIPFTTNLMMSSEDSSMDPGLNYWQLARELDVVSWDSYPSWHLPGYKMLALESDPTEAVDDYRRASEVAFQHDLFRSLGGGKPFLLMESTPSNTNWQPISKLKKPGMNITSSLQAVAHGSDSVQYFQWRKSRGSFEKFHGAVVSHRESAEDRVFSEAAELGAKLNKLESAQVFGSRISAGAALYFDWENRWAFEDSKGPRNDSRKAYVETVKAHYYALWSQGADIDIVHSGSDFSVYKLIIVPMGYLMPEDTAARLASFVEAGGNLITTYFTGMVNESDLCYSNGTPGPLTEVLGIEVSEIDPLYPGERNSMKTPASGVSAGLKLPEYSLRDYCELIRPQTAEVLAEYGADFYAGSPALTRNSYGRGQAFHIAARSEDSLHIELYRKLLEECDLLDHCHGWNLPAGIDIRFRGDAVFIMNYSADNQVIEIPEDRAYRYLHEQLDCSGRLELPAYATEVLIKE